MEVIKLSFIGLMGSLSVIDFKTLRVPAWGLLALCVLIALKGNYAPINTIYGALLMLASLLISDLMLGRETLGGGDLWLGILMSSFMGFDKFLTAYIVAAILGYIAMLTIYRKNRTLDVAYVPYMAMGAFWAMFISKI